MKNKNQLLNKMSNPLAQAGASLVFSVLFMLLGKIVSLTGIMEISTLFSWKTAAALLLFFALTNSLLSLSTPNLLIYWRNSIYGYMGLAIGAGLAAWLFSGLSIYETGVYKWIYFVVTIGYLVFISIIGMMRKIVKFAEEEEWEEPRFDLKK